MSIVKPCVPEWARCRRVTLAKLARPGIGVERRLALAPGTRHHVASDDVLRTLVGSGPAQSLAGSGTQPKAPDCYCGARIFSTGSASSDRRSRRASNTGRLNVTDPTPVARRARLRWLVPLAEVRERGWVTKTEDLDVLEDDVQGLLGLDSLAGSAQFAVASRRLNSFAPLTVEQTAWLAHVRRVATARPIPDLDLGTLADCAASLPIELRHGCHQTRRARPGSRPQSRRQLRCRSASRRPWVNGSSSPSATGGLGVFDLATHGQLRISAGTRVAPCRLIDVGCDWHRFEQLCCLADTEDAESRTRLLRARPVGRFVQEWFVWLTIAPRLRCWSS